MNKSLIFALSLMLVGFKFAVPASAHCGHCDDDKAAQPAKCNDSSASCDSANKEKCEKASAAKCEAKHKRTSAKCDDSSASGDSAKKEKCEKVSAAKCEAKHKKTQEQRVSDLENCLKDVGCRDEAGSPYTSKSQISTRSKSNCPMSKCPKGKAICPKEKCS